ncbi:hypothetical protein D5086_023945 [Populus alba]|uniref:Uncharacterized protein n=1 Tax=Populus alba TaxID=43335 RepID=A0ACC4B4G6_POPAL
MATETAPSHQTPTSDHESIENKVTEEVKPVELETVSLAGKPEEEDLKPNELESQPTLLDKSEAVEDKEVEPPAVVVKKIDDVAAINVPVDDKKELETDSISDSHTPSVPALVADVVIGEPVAPAIHSVSKEAEEQQLSTSVEELLQEKPKMVDVPVSLHEAIEKTEEPSKVLPIKESEPIEAKDSEDSAVSKEVDKVESIIPEVEVKLEEQSEVGKQVEEPKTEAATKQPKEHLEVLPVKSEAIVVKDSEDSQLVSKEDDKPESEEQSEVIKVEPKEKSVEVIAETQELVEALPIKEMKAVQVAQAEIKEDGGKSSLPEIIQKAVPEAEGTDLVEASLKEIVVEAKKGREENEAGTIKAEGEKIASDTVKEELAQPIKVEEVSNAASNAKITEKSFEGEKTVESVEPALENKKEEIPAIDETHKDGNIEGKLDEATTAVSEPVKESQDSVSEAKEEEGTAKTNEENSEQEKVDEIAKSDTQNLEYSVKDAEDAKESQDLPREVPAKPAQKHSNNILTRVKQSLVKAKKAIIGKSPTPKTVSSDSKGDVKVNN